MKGFNNVKIKKIKNKNKIGILLATLILLLLITFSLLRLLPIGKFLDDFIFFLFFGWSKYLVYILLYIALIPICFSNYFKFKSSFIWATIVTIICCAWTIETITIISHHYDIWFSNKLHINIIKDYYQSWWKATIFNNYHGFFAAPISFESWTITNFFPPYLTGGVIANTLIALLSYATFFVNFIINILAIIISFSWLFLNRPLILFTTISNHLKEIILELKIKWKNQKINKLKNAKAKQKKATLIKENSNKITNLKKELKANKKQAKLATKQLKKTALIKENINKINNLKKELKANKKQAKLATKELAKANLITKKTKNNINVDNMQSNDLQMQKKLNNNQNLAMKATTTEQETIITKKELKANKKQAKLAAKQLKKAKKRKNNINDNNINNQDLAMKTITTKQKTKRFIPKPIFINKKYILPTLKPVKKSENLIINQKANEKYALENKIKIDQLFKEFAVQGKVNGFTVGTTVTKYEITITSGMKINKITNLEEELKLALANNNIVIETPIAGKSMIGIEVGNKNIVPVDMEEQFKNMDNKYKDKKLLISIGRNTTGDYIFHSLKEMHHLLVAGSTGSGKSVFINDLLISLLLQYKPHEIKLILVDPKWVELAIYNDIPHLLVPVINEASKTLAALQVVILEMIHRYQLLAKNETRNIDSYNEKIKKESNKLPYYIIIIDELADLMVQASKEIEEGIMRITQMGRAAGIHLVIATQRPSIDVITGVIKNNIPSRIAFKVSSWIDSKTILDSAGAEKLLGKGDMLFLVPGQTNTSRLQAPWISDEDVAELINFIKKQAPADYDDNFIEKMEEIKKTKK